MKKRKTLRLIIILVAAYLAFTTIQGTINLLSSGEKMTRREQVLIKLKKDRAELIRKGKWVGSKEYMEQVAYEELGLSKPGEKVFIIPKELLSDKSPKIVIDTTPNWKKWVELIL